MSLEQDSRAKDKTFSPEGLLNRNFGKDVEKPSDALFYRDGILNRQKYQENIRAEREKQDEVKAKTMKERLLGLFGH